MYSFLMRRPRQQITEHARARKTGESRDEIQMICREESPSCLGGERGRGEGRGGRGSGVWVQRRLLFSLKSFVDLLSQD